MHPGHTSVGPTRPTLLLLGEAIPPKALATKHEAKKGSFLGWQGKTNGTKQGRDCRVPKATSRSGLRPPRPNLLIYARRGHRGHRAAQAPAHPASSQPPPRRPAPWLRPSLLPLGRRFPPGAQPPAPPRRRVQPQRSFRLPPGRQGNRGPTAASRSGPSACWVLADQRAARSERGPTCWTLLRPSEAGSEDVRFRTALFFFFLEGFGVRRTPQNFSFLISSPNHLLTKLPVPKPE